MQFLEERGQADDAAKPTDPLDQHHELAMLFRELVAYLLECRVHHDDTRHIPVLNSDGELCGILTQRDLFRGILLRSLGYGSRVEQKLLDSLSIKDAMHDEVLTISPESTLSDAADLMLSNKVGCLPVVDGEQLVGMISEADFVKQFAGPTAG